MPNQLNTNREGNTRQPTRRASELTQDAEVPSSTTSSSTHGVTGTVSRRTSTLPADPDNPFSKEAFNSGFAPPQPTSTAPRGVSSSKGESKEKAEKPRDSNTNPFKDYTPSGFEVSEQGYNVREIGVNTTTSPRGSWGYRERAGRRGGGRSSRGRGGRSGGSSSRRGGGQYYPPRGGAGGATNATGGQGGYSPNAASFYSSKWY